MYKRSVANNGNFRVFIIKNYLVPNKYLEVKNKKPTRCRF